jgi:predicted SAM-dependent methyltransferase
MDLIKYKDKEYPLYQTFGNASQFAIPFALHFCKGSGYDIGCMKKEWAFPGAIPIDLSFYDSYHALNLPHNNVDYIYSSHCLEHINDWVDVMDYWYGTLRLGGILFLYLPHFSQEYWRPWNNRKHKHVLTPEIISSYMESKCYKNIMVSGCDLNNSFMILGEK